MLARRGSSRPWTRCATAAASWCCAACPCARYSDDDVGLIFWGMGRYLGGPLHQNPEGDLLGHVYDHGRTYGNIDVRGYETNAYLPYHTDAGDMVGLLCLRRGSRAGSAAS